MTVYYDNHYDDMYHRSRLPLFFYFKTGRIDF